MQGGDFNLYENMRCHGVPLVTISRGRVVYENGVFMCAEGTGKFCPLRSFPDTVYKKLVQREKVRGGGGSKALLATSSVTLLGGQGKGTWTFPGQGVNLRHSSDSSHCSDITRSVATVPKRTPVS